MAFLPPDLLQIFADLQRPCSFSVKKVCPLVLVKHQYNTNSSSKNLKDKVKIKLKTEFYVLEMEATGVSKILNLRKRFVCY